MCAIHKEWPIDTITLYANIDMTPLAVEHPEHRVQGGGVAVDGGGWAIDVEGEGVADDEVVLVFTNGGGGVA